MPAGEGATPLEVLGSILLILALVGAVAMFAGLTPVNPNEARALVLFGHYDGTLRNQGLQWVNPFTERRRISVRVRNFETARLKVNDHDGNPIEIAAVVVWKVTDTAEALFEVDDYENFVHVQAEAALRNLATTHPYDAHREEDVSLRSNLAEVAAQLRTEVQDRLQKAGVEVIEARISHLAYAPEIAKRTPSSRPSSPPGASCRRSATRTGSPAGCTGTVAVVWTTQRVSSCVHSAHDLSDEPRECRPG